jgi:hypothetical protein
LEKKRGLFLFKSEGVLVKSGGVLTCYRLFAFVWHAYVKLTDPKSRLDPKWDLSLSMSFLARICTYEINLHCIVYSVPTMWWFSLLIQNIWMCKVMKWSVKTIWKLLKSVIIIVKKIYVWKLRLGFNIIEYFVCMNLVFLLQQPCKSSDGEWAQFQRKER